MPKGPFLAKCGHYTTRTRAQSDNSQCLSCEKSPSPLSLHLLAMAKPVPEEPEELTLEERVERLEREVETLRAIIPRR